MSETHRKDSVWFEHDSNARHDARMVRIRAAHGMAGYGTYWAIIETLRDQAGYRIAHDEHLVTVLSMSIGSVESKLVESVLNMGLDLGLFKSKDGKFYSPALIHRMERWDNRREIMKDAAERRWAKSKGLYSKECNGADASAYAQALDKHIQTNKKENKQERKKDVPAESREKRQCLRCSDDFMAPHAQNWKNDPDSRLCDCCASMGIKASEHEASKY